MPRRGGGGGSSKCLLLLIREEGEGVDDCLRKHSGCIPQFELAEENVVNLYFFRFNK